MSNSLAIFTESYRHPFVYSSFIRTHITSDFTFPSILAHFSCLRGALRALLVEAPPQSLAWAHPLRTLPQGACVGPRLAALIVPVNLVTKFTTQQPRTLRLTQHVILRRKLHRPVIDP